VISLMLPRIFGQKTSVRELDLEAALAEREVSYCFVVAQIVSSLLKYCSYEILVTVCICPILSRFR